MYSSSGTPLLLPGGDVLSAGDVYRPTADAWRSAARPKGFDATDRSVVATSGMAVLVRPDGLGLYEPATDFVSFAGWPNSTVRPTAVADPRCPYGEC
jgi:hypothetical protein